MLSYRELTDMRGTFRASCDRRCVIRDPGEPISGPGGTEPGPEVVTTALCRVADLAGAEREVGGRLSGVADVMILVEHGVTVTWDSTIEIGPAKYGVVRVAADSTQPVALRVYGQEVT